MGACSCSHDEQPQVPSSEAEITALAEAAADNIANSDRTDTLAIQSAIMEARAQHSAFVLTGNNNDAETYDNALRERLMKLDAQLCDTIFATVQ